MKSRESARDFFLKLSRDFRDCKFCNTPVVKFVHVPRQIFLLSKFKTRKSRAAIFFSRHLPVLFCSLMTEEEESCKEFVDEKSRSTVEKDSFYIIHALDFHKTATWAICFMLRMYFYLLFMSFSCLRLEGRKSF